MRRQWITRSALLLLICVLLVLFFHASFFEECNNNGVNCQVAGQFNSEPSMTTVVPPVTSERGDPIRGGRTRRADHHERRSTAKDPLPLTILTLPSNMFQSQSCTLTPLASTIVPKAFVEVMALDPSQRDRAELAEIITAFRALHNTALQRTQKELRLPQLVKGDRRVLQRLPQLFVLDVAEKGTEPEAAVAFRAELADVLTSGGGSSTSGVTHLSFCRIVGGEKILLETFNTTCKIVQNQQQKRGGAHSNHAFRAAEPILTFPIVLSRDVLLFMDSFYGHAILENDRGRQSSGNQEASGNKKTNIDDVLHQPWLAACGIENPVLRSAEAKGLYDVLRGWVEGSQPPMTRLGLEECLPLLLSGRDVHRVTLHGLLDLTKANLHREADKGTPSHLFLYNANEEYPFSALPSSALREQSAQMTDGTGLVSDEVYLEDLRKRMTYLDAGSSSPSPYPSLHLDRSLEVFAATTINYETELSRRQARQQELVNAFPVFPGSGDSSPDLPDSAVLAPLYIPLLSKSFAARDGIRCFHLSLPKYMRQAIPLHFAIGVNKLVDIPYLARPHRPRRMTEEATEGLAVEGGVLSVAAAPQYYTRYDEDVPLSKQSIWHRMALENQSFHPHSPGDLLLFDLPDHDDKTVSAMLLKLLLCMLHMTVRYPTALFLIRGSDDAHHIVPRLYMDIRALLIDRTEEGSVSSSSSTDTATAWRKRTEHMRDLQTLNRRSRRSETIAGNVSIFGTLDRNGRLLRRRRVVDGHVISRFMRKFCDSGETNLPREATKVGEPCTVCRNDRLRQYLRPTRNIGPLAFHWFVSGGGGLFSDDVTMYLSASSSFVPPLLWLEEDTNFGRLVAPFASPFDNFRVHDFFNATTEVDTAFSGSVPRMFDYCSPQDWIVHKNPWDSLQRVDEVSHELLCRPRQQEADRVHQCWRQISSRWAKSRVGREGLPPRRLKDLFLNIERKKRPSKKSFRTDRWGWGSYFTGGATCDPLQLSWYMGKMVNSTRCRN